MASWLELETELETWQQTGNQATFWWRDDDACVLTPQLRRLVEIADNTEVTVHLAVIPAKLEDDTVRFLSASGNFRVLQHGYSHTDHAPKGQGSWELGDHRPLETIEEELANGFKILENAFSGKFLPILVPPWTRIGQNLLPVLSRAGYKALSLEEGVLDTETNDIDVKVINTHCDPIKWKENAQFKGTQRVLDDFVDHLKRRRLGMCNRDELTGLCTHHMDHSAELWQFIEKFLHITKRHAGARWLSLDTVLS